MGTFRAEFTVFSTSGGTAGGGGRFIALTTQNMSVTYILDGDCWFLDGSVVGINFSGLPSGFVIPTQVGVRRVGGGSIGGLRRGSVLDSATSNVSFGLWTDANTAAATAGVTYPVNAPVISNGSSVINPIELTGFFVISESIVLNIGADASLLANTFDAIELFGTYSAFAFQYTINPTLNIEKNRGPASAQPNGTRIRIESDPNDPTHVELDHVTITLPCGIPEIIVQTEFLIIFFVPSGPCEGDVPVTATGDGTQFSGSVVLGTLDVLATNGSGVYQLTLGATHDELYSSIRDGSTFDVKIPNPFGKTGIIGG